MADVHQTRGTGVSWADDQGSAPSPRECRVPSLLERQDFRRRVTWQLSSDSNGRLTDPLRHAAAVL